MSDKLQLVVFVRACKLMSIGYLIHKTRQAKAYRTLRTETLPIFARDNECLDHFGGLVVPTELIQLPKPEVVTVYVTIWWLVRISTGIAQVLHQDKRLVELVGERR